jgi:nitrogen fixation protein NifU and related proteins
VSNLDALYQEVILDHNRRPRNYGALPDADRVVPGRNPSCGDELTLWLKLDGDTIADARFEARGCAISRASASLMTAAVRGKRKDEAERLFDRFHDLVTGKLDVERDAEAKAALGSLVALGGVSRFPIRVKCASLAWHALKSALADRAAADDAVTTESP